MRVAKIKSTLKRELQVETLNRHTDQDNSLIVNGSVMLRESPGLYRQGSDLERQECSRIWCLLGIRQIHGVSSKHQTEGSKPTASPYVDHAAAITKGIADSYTTQDPANIFDCSGSPEGSDQLKLCGHKLVVTGRDPIPVEINKDIVVRRCDLNAVQEETDVIMSRQMIAIS